MATKIIRQEDGKFGLFSTVSDRIYAVDCDEAEMIRIWSRNAAERAEEDKRKWVLEKKRWLEEIKIPRLRKESSITLKQAIKEHQFVTAEFAAENPEYQDEFEFDQEIQKIAEREKK